MIILTFLPGYVTAALALAVIWYGVWLVLTDSAPADGADGRAVQKALLAGIVIAPMAAIVPWMTPGGVAVAAFSLAAAVLWVAELRAARREAASGWGLPAAAALATFLSPQAIVLVAAMAVFHLARRRAGSRAMAASMLAMSVATFAVFFLMLEVSEWTPQAFAATAASGMRRGWAAADWYGAKLGKNFLRMHLAYNRWFYWPMALPLAALLRPARREWWFAPTLLWAAALFLGTVLIGRETDVFYSLPMQAALLVPSGAAGMRCALGSREPAKR